MNYPTMFGPMVTTRAGWVDVFIAQLRAHGHEAQAMAAADAVEFSDGFISGVILHGDVPCIGFAAVAPNGAQVPIGAVLPGQVSDLDVETLEVLAMLDLRAPDDASGLEAA